jgi:hypothetical protein
VADNVELDPGTGGAVVATDEVTGTLEHVPLTKVAVSADGSRDLVPADAANGLDVDVTRSALPSGAATSAKQDTAQTALDAIKTAVEILDNAVAGTEIQVDVVGALPAGDNNIGNVDIATIAAGDNNIGNVDVVTSGLPTGASTSAKQDTEITHLSAIDADTGTIAGAVAGTEMQVDVVGSLPAGNANIGDVDLASAIPAGTNLIGSVNIKPATTGGMSISTDIDLDETETEIKGGAGHLFGWYIYNDGAAEVYVKLYNATAANVVVGTTVPVMTLGIPAGSGSNVFTDQGIAFSTAICAAATTVATTADTTAPAANQVIANFFYA